MQQSHGMFAIAKFRVQSPSRKDKRTYSCSWSYKTVIHNGV